jgi:PHD-zinc-finger like domain/BAH domain/PHD-finger
MEFLPAKNEPDLPIDAVRVNWYYRPKDIQRRVQDTRIVFASMHSDTCPLTSLRGKCNIQHISDIPNLDQYRTQKDSFWFSSLYDRYMQRYYEVILTSKVINVPQHVKNVLDERWKFVLVEVGRGRELTSAVKTCKKCSQYSANHDSVDCAVCKNTYHMACIRPPLLKKPARGFAWACAACSRAQELKLEARNTPTLTDSGLNGEDEPVEEEEEDPTSRGQMTRESSVAPGSHPPPTAAQIAQANLWPYRYLGIHCRVEDALDYDDRIYPRASSRLGPRHQANVTVWHGRPVELVKPADVKKKYVKNAAHKKDPKLSRETLAALEAEKESKLKRPKWVVDEPLGYVHRGEDTPVEIRGKKEYTAQLIFKMPDASTFTHRGSDDTDSLVPEDREKLVDEYMAKAKLLAGQYNVLDSSTDFLTKAIEKLQENGYDSDKALAAMKELNIRTDLKQPDLNREEVKRFEEGVAKYGSELHNVARHVSPTIKEARIVRYYYTWKKTERGRQIWGNYEGRRSKKESKRVEKDGSGTKLLDDVADDQDDSAFDNEKAAEKKRGFECKFCSTRKSRQWRRAPGTAPGTLVPSDSSYKGSKDKSNWLTLALCGKCAYLWRRYAIQYESIEEVSKKIAAAGGRASKRKIDEELMRTIVEAQGETGDPISANTAAVAASAGVDVPASIIENQEPLKKKSKPDQLTNGHTEAAVEKKKTVPAPPPEPEPLVPEMPRVRIHPCAVCHIENLPGDELLKCRDCRLHVHKSCYGIPPESNNRPWFCDMCLNDHNTQVSTIYECVLCPVKFTAQELMEPLKISHKKKTDREREKERLEREMVQEAGRRWRQEQESAGRPVNPREALKRTAWNNWVHVICAIWTEEIKFGNAELFDEAEGIGFIPREKFTQPCVICRQKKGKPTVSCFYKDCTTRFHVGCAHQAEFFFGFDIFLPKGTRREVKPMMQLDRERGHARPVIYCPHHNLPVDPPLHSMLEATDEGITALQLYARLYKQVDQSITATARRAAQFTQNLPAPIGLMGNATRQITVSNGTEATASLTSADELPAEPESIGQDSKASEKAIKSCKCCTCSVDVSPRWYKIRRPARNTPKISPVAQTNGNEDIARRNRNSAGVDTQSSITSPNSIATESNAHPDALLTNGIVKVEGPPDLVTADGPLPSTEEGLDQCHKCHHQKLSPPSSSPRPLPVGAPPSQEEPPPGPQFYQAPVHTRSPYAPWHPPLPSTEVPPHSHTGAQPTPHHWQSAPHSHHYQSWSAPARNGVPPPPPPGPTFHHGPPPGPYDLYGRGYPQPYGSGPPPGRAQPNGHHSPTPVYGYPHPLPHGPPPPSLPPSYPQSPQVYGQHDHPRGTSPRLHNRPPSQPRTYAPPPPLDPHASHSRPPRIASPQQHTYSAGPLPLSQSYRQGPAPPLSTQNLSQIAQSAEAQMGQERGIAIGHGHRDGPTQVQGQAVQLRSGSVDPARPSTPNDRSGGGENERDRDAGNGSGRGLAGAGASASPNLKNLLS